MNEETFKDIYAQFFPQGGEYHFFHGGGRGGTEENFSGI